VSAQHRRPVAQRKHRLPPRQRGQERQGRQERIGRVVDLPPVAAKQPLELLATEPGGPVQGARRPAGDLLGADLLEHALLGELA
jgi:hypothetical protein